MRVLFGFSEPVEANAFPLLDRVIYAIQDHGHQFSAPSGLLPEELGSYFNAYPIHRELLEKELVQDAYRSHHIRTLTVCDAPAMTAWPVTEEVELIAENAARYLAEPLTLLVENELDDGDLYKLMLSSVDARLGRDFWVTRMVTFAHAGGKGEVPKLVLRRYAESLERGYPRRLIAIVDGDRKYPGHVGDNGPVRGACSITRFGFHALEKRAIENYLSDRTLLAYAQRAPEVTPAVSFFLGLSREQRDHHPIKRAFEQKKLVAMGAEEAALYSGVKDGDLLSMSLGQLVRSYLSHDPEMSLHDLTSRYADVEMRTLAEQIWTWV